MKAMSSSSNVGGRRWFVTLGTRPAIPVLVLVTGVAAASYAGLGRTSRLRSKEVAADRVAQLTVLSMMPAARWDEPHHRYLKQQRRPPISGFGFVFAALRCSCTGSTLRCGARESLAKTQNLAGGRAF